MRTETGNVAPIISIKNLSKRFGATQALNDVSIDINSGEVMALLGANGAGKSTVIKILAKIYSPDSGSITTPDGGSLDDVRFAFIHQDLGLVEWMTVGESVALGSEYPMKNGVISWSGVRDMAKDALASVAPHINVNDQISSLSRADRSLVAIARALYAKSDVLILDEPTASLHSSDCESLFAVLRRLRDSGVAVVYVSHRLDEIFKVSDRVVVLRDGKLVEDGPVDSFTPQTLVTAIVGRQTASFNLSGVSHGDVVLKVENLVSNRVLPTSFELRQGEVLGLIGLNGAGQREVGRTIAGAIPQTGGVITLDGKILSGNIANAVRHGISLITSSRAEEGLFMNYTVRENIFSNVTARGSHIWSLIRKKQEKVAAGILTEEFNVKPRNTELAIATLSGGNQQKVILSRWLSFSRKVIILEEPTAGVDVGAKGDIYRLIHEATLKNLAILLVSTDFEEVALMAHRALVFSEGEVVKELERSEISIANLVTYASRANVSV
ncbi:MAG: sugar ABC transporter ATP-binding protein [Actinomycetes bacterium]